MRRLQPPLQAALLAMMCATASTTAIPLNDLFVRQSTCPANFATCPGSIFPQTFCCLTGQTCIPLAGRTTLLCCPQGFACDKIESIPCDISLQDAAKHPEALLKTTALNGVLPKCGDKCCPFGYTCSKPGECVKDADQSKSPPNQSSSSTMTSSATTSRSTSTAPPNTLTASPSSTVTSVAEPTPTLDATTGASESAEIEASESNGPPVGVIAGVTVGVIAAILLAILIAWLLVRRKRKPQNSPSLKLTRSSSSFGNIISNPIIVEGTAMRSDFNRGPAKRSFEELAPIPRNVSPMTVSPMTVSPPSSSGSGASRTRDLTGNGLRQSSVAYGGPPPYATPPNSSRKQESSLFPPQTPRQDREPSSVSINVFADPLALTPESASNAPGANARRHSNMTTFTQLMDEADLGGVARGQPFIPHRPSTPQGGSPARR